jgi:membrane protein
MDLKERLVRPLAERWPWVATAVRVQERFSEVHGSQLAAAITLSSFLSIFPLLLVAIGVLGFFSRGVSDLPGKFIEQLGLTGRAADTLTSAIETAERSRKTASVVGLGGLLLSGLSLVNALQTAFDSAWQVSGRGLKDKLYGLGWLLGASLILMGSFAVTAFLRSLPGPVTPLVLAATLFVDAALWLWTFKVLTNRQVGLKPLLPGAVLGAVGLEVLKTVGGIYVPGAVASSSALYGTLGVVFAILAWLLFFGRLAVYSVVLNVVCWERSHGTTTTEIELPRVPRDIPVGATRAGEAQEVKADQ